MGDSPIVTRRSLAWPAHEEDMRGRPNLEWLLATTEVSNASPQRIDTVHAALGAGGTPCPPIFSGGCCDKLKANQTNTSSKCNGKDRAKAPRPSQNRQRDFESCEQPQGTPPSILGTVYSQVACLALLRSLLASSLPARGFKSFVHRGG